MLTETALFCSIALGIAPIQTETRVSSLLLGGRGELFFPFPTGTTHPMKIMLT